MRYPGGKGKTYHQIINLLPPHKTYIETHLGGGAVLRNKKSAADRSLAMDRDPKVIEHWRRCFPSLASYVEADALEFLTTTHFTGEEVIYCDPPYLPCTRRRRRVYRYDYDTHDHEALLKIICCLPSRIVISGYPSELYDSELHDWSTLTFTAKAHNGIRTEKVWFNFEPPKHLHDPRYLGNNFRERQTHRRRIDRLQRRIGSLSSQEQHSLSEWLANRLSGG